MTSDKPRLGYIGLGAMGGAMCRNLINAGYSVNVYDVDKMRTEHFQDLGATPAQTPEAVGTLSEIVFTSLPGSTQVMEVFLGEQGVISGAHPGLVAADMSTVPPAVSRKVAARLADDGVGFLDCPVARTREAAIAGTLSIMVGGPEVTFQSILPVLQVMGTDVVRVGEVGAGQVAKLLNNAILMSNIVTAAEALAVGIRAGVDPASLVEVLSNGSGDSFALRNHVAKSILPGEFAPHRFPLDYALKDLSYFFELCRDTESVCIQLSSTQELYHAARNRGFHEEYFPVVAKVIEALSGVSITRDAGEP